MKVSLIQLNSKDNKEENFSKAISYLKQSLKEKPDIICLSERFLYWGDDKLEEAEDTNSDKIVAFGKGMCPPPISNTTSSGLMLKLLYLC